MIGHVAYDAQLAHPFTCGFPASLLHPHGHQQSDQALTSRLDLTGIPATSAAQVYDWTGGAIRRLADRAAPAGGFTATFPARSATLYVVPA